MLTAHLDLAQILPDHDKILFQQIL